MKKKRFTRAISIMISENDYQEIENTQRKKTSAFPSMSEMR